MRCKKSDVFISSTRLLAVAAVLLVGCSETRDGEGEVDRADATAIAACNYESPFTSSAECREYTGQMWAEADVAASCTELAGELAMGGSCPVTYRLGTCSLTDGDGFDYVVSSYGEEDACDLQKTGCELFGGGAWTADAMCSDGGGTAAGNVFIQPTLDCRDPLPGQPPGQSANGQVCTWQSIAGCTEQGRRFSDYASCDVVRSQRPYYPVQPAPTAGRADPRLQDPAYVTELNWVRSQVEASACVCCHSTQDTPQEPSNWFLESEGNWIDSMYDTGLALGANIVSSEAFGAFRPEDNNGFDRTHSGFPSTDPERMVAFFTAELAYRGRTAADFATTPPFGGPIYDQLVYEPTACMAGEGVRSDGTIEWRGGDARYVQVLDANAANPTVPPNLDLPEGTLWRLDVPSTGDAVASTSVRYGEVPAGLTQRFPAFGAPAALVPGETYYLYVTLDVGIPITRCLFTFE